jgi:hypothetical protein
MQHHRFFTPRATLSLLVATLAVPSCAVGGKGNRDDEYGGFGGTPTTSSSGTGAGTGSSSASSGTASSSSSSSSSGTTSSSSTSSSSTSSSSTSSSSTSGSPSGGSCYVGQGDCNPMTKSCGAGEACDLATDNQFHCFPPPNNVGLGGACDAQNGPYCQDALTCVSNLCAKFCCIDADCGGTCTSLGMAGTIEVKVCQ